MNGHVRWVGLVAVAWLGLVGCGTGGGERAAPPATGGHAGWAGDGAPRAVRLAGMSPGKPRAPVGLALEGGGGVLVTGVPASATLLLQADADADGVELLLEGSGGVEILAPAGRLFLGPAAAGEVQRVPVQWVVHDSSAPARLEALVVLEAGGERLARPVTLNLRVDGKRRSGDAPSGVAKPSAAPAEDSTGELIYSMQAETTVK